MLLLCAAHLRREASLPYVRRMQVETRALAEDVERLAAATKLSQRTVYRWFAEPERTNRGNAQRLAAAARRLCIALPVARGAAA